MNKKQNKSAPLAGARLLTTSEMMQVTGHRDRQAFYQFVRRNSIPLIKLGAKTIRFEESAVRAYLDSKSVGRIISQ